MPWATPKKPVPPELNRAISNALDGCRGQTFADRANRDKFLDRVSSALAHFERVKTESAQQDRDLDAARAERIARAAKGLSNAFDALSEEDRELLIDVAWPGRFDLDSAPRAALADSLKKNLKSLGEGAETLSEIYRRGRGEYDRISPSARFLVYQIAYAWRIAFNVRPSSSENGSFARVLTAILEIVMPDQPFGNAALRSTLSR